MKETSPRDRRVSGLRTTASTAAAIVFLGVAFAAGWIWCSASSSQADWKKAGEFFTIGHHLASEGGFTPALPRQMGLPLFVETEGETIAYLLDSVAQDDPDRLAGGWFHLWEYFRANECARAKTYLGAYLETEMGKRDSRLSELERALNREGC